MPFVKGDHRINRKGRPRKYNREGLPYSREENVKNATLFYNHGIGLSDYNEMLEKQSGVCAICGQPETKMQVRKRGGEKVLDSLQVDHCHDTGVIRGLLCWKCNVGIVKLLDNRELAIKAAAYLGARLEYADLGAPLQYNEITTGD